MQLALSGLEQNNMFSMLPFLMGGSQTDTETKTNIFSATNVNKKGS